MLVYWVNNAMPCTGIKKMPELSDEFETANALCTSSPSLDANHSSNLADSSGFGNPETTNTDSGWGVPRQQVRDVNNPVDQEAPSWNYCNSLKVGECP